MAKKKKKRASQPEQSKSPGQKTAGSTQKPQISDRSTPAEASSVLELKLRRSEGKASSASLKLDSTPILYVDEIDAAKIHAQKGSEVFLLIKDQKSNSNALVGTLVCKIDISSSGKSPDKNSKRKNHVLPGTCTLQPSSFLDSILH